MHYQAPLKLSNQPQFTASGKQAKSPSAFCQTSSSSCQSKCSHHHRHEPQPNPKLPPQAVFNPIPTIVGSLGCLSFLLHNLLFCFFYFLVAEKRKVALVLLQILKFCTLVFQIKRGYRGRQISLNFRFEIFRKQWKYVRFKLKKFGVIHGN